MSNRFQKPCPDRIDSGNAGRTLRDTNSTPQQKSKAGFLLNQCKQCGGCKKF